MDTAPSGANVTLQPTQLISARVPKPRQWVITLAQLTKSDGVSPWGASFDGSAAAPTVATFTAPTVPTNAAALMAVLQATLRWGAGGAAFETRFDYPSVGGMFGVLADAVDLNVAVRSTAAQNAYSPSLVPFVGGFMVPGIAADPTPLRWAEETAAFAAAESRFWSIKPYARKVRFTAPGATSVAGQFLAWTGAGGTTGLRTVRAVEDQAGEGVDELWDVPPGASLFTATNLGAVGSAIFVEWYIGLV